MNIEKKLRPVFESRVGTKYRVDEEYEYGDWKTVFEDENGEHWKDIPGLGGMTNIGREEPGYNSDYTIRTQTRDLQYSTVVAYRTSEQGEMSQQPGFPFLYEHEQMMPCVAVLSGDIITFPGGITAHRAFIEYEVMQ